MRAIDPRYHIKDDRIIKTSNDDVVPEDEPLILIRAHDRLALNLLKSYLAECEKDGCTPYQLASIDNRIAAFRKFSIDHPERMKQPGITKGV